MASWLVPLFALVMSGAFLVESFSLKRMPGADPAGPALYPRIVIAGTILVALAILAQILWQARGRLATLVWPVRSGTDPAVEPGIVVRVAIAMALTLIYPVAIQKIGFVLATFAVTVALMRLFDRRIGIGIGLAAAVSLSLHFFFAELLGARIVPGEWIDPMRALGV